MKNNKNIIDILSCEKTEEELKSVRNLDGEKIFKTNNCIKKNGEKCATDLAFEYLDVSALLDYEINFKIKPNQSKIKKYKAQLLDILRHKNFDKKVLANWIGDNSNSPKKLTYKKNKDS